jgi:hypothetical protein
MRTGHPPPSDDDIALTDQLLNLESHVGKGCSELLRCCLLSRRPWRRIAGSQVMTDVILGNQLVSRVQVSPIP